ncbi:hypothetical protein SNE40_012601 [Patella caerulea]|uniref:BPTI/Kunitz inhibitor domain-containing protein n=1 Tax=Patella caerulea TaxID=87958 RepID=A0AAN8PNJ1_PATCE
MRFAVAVAALIITAIILLTTCEVEAVAGSVPVPIPVPAICKLPKVTGPCRAYFPRYYYNTRTNECTKFIYGGCRGNENRFRSEDECEHTCRVPVPVPAICKLPKVTGPCRGAFPRYYYNTRTNECTKFIYGGCQGNENRFRSEDECEHTCRVPVPAICKLPKVTGPCRGAFPRYYYNTRTNECTKFIYGGCQGNENRFRSEDECEHTCQGSVPVPVPAICKLPKVRGPCRAYFPRYYYNTRTNECTKFIYGGCRGNENRFRSEDECEHTCQG